MTDHHDEEELRAALRAEVAGVEGDPSLLDRINAIASSGVAARRAGRQRLVVVAAAFVLAIGTVAALTQTDDDGDQRIRVAGGDSSSTPSVDPQARCPGVDLAFGIRDGASPVDVEALIGALEDDERVNEVRADRPSGGRAQILLDVASTDDVQAFVQWLWSGNTAVDGVEMRCDAAQVSIPPDLTRRHQGVPALMALVREDGWLVVADLESGRVTPILDGGDPADVTPEAPSVRSYIESIEVSPDGQWVYVAGCCEPAGGNIYRVPTSAAQPIDRAEVESVASGYHPRISPDGQWLATASIAGDRFEAVCIGPVDPTGEDPICVDVDGYVTDLAWAPDGRHLGVRLTSMPGEEGATEWTSTVTLRDAQLVPPRLVPRDLVVDDYADRSDLRRFPLFAPDSSPRQVDPAVEGTARTMRTDAFSTSLLWVDDDGVVFATSPTGEPVALPDLPAARLADW
jgi:dipeptidyl aminopeptidase/acylaminoacyl peptidase